MNNIQLNNFINLIKVAITGEEVKLVDLDIDFCERLARFSSLEYLINYAFGKCGIEGSNEFKKIAKVNGTKSVVQDVELEYLSQVFNEGGIDFLPLKGAVIRKLYPSIEMRNMADLDILVKENQLKLVHKLLVANGYKKNHECEHHISYMKEPYMNIEIHTKAASNIMDYASYYDNIWEKSILVKDHEYKFKNEDLMIFVISHFSKHFRLGGSGIRSLIDIYLIEKIDHDQDYLISELDKINLKKFYLTFSKLVNDIFNGNELDGDQEALLEYVTNSGTYGTRANHNAVDVSKYSNNEAELKKSKRKTIFSSLFPSYHIMCGRNPSLKKVPILLPWFWFTRLLKGLFHFRSSKDRYDRINEVNIEEVNNVSKIMEMVGINNEN